MYPIDYMPPPPPIYTPLTLCLLLGPAVGVGGGAVGLAARDAARAAPHPNPQPGMSTKPDPCYTDLAWSYVYKSPSLGIARCRAFI